MLKTILPSPTRQSQSGSPGMHCREPGLARLLAKTHYRYLHDFFKSGIAENQSAMQFFAGINTF